MSKIPYLNFSHDWGLIRCKLILTRWWLIEVPRYCDLFTGKQQINVSCVSDGIPRSTTGSILKALQPATSSALQNQELEMPRTTWTATLHLWTENRSVLIAVSVSLLTARDGTLRVICVVCWGSSGKPVSEDLCTRSQVVLAATLNLVEWWSSRSAHDNGFRTMEKDI